MRAIAILLIYTLVSPSSEGGVDLYLDPEQAEEIFGAEEEGEGEENYYYFVKDGVVNRLAVLQFQEQVVPTSVPRLLLHWRGTNRSTPPPAPPLLLPPPEEVPGVLLPEDEDIPEHENVPEESEEGEQPVSYSLHAVHTPGAAMGRPSFNVSAVGEVPEAGEDGDGETLAVELPCTGLADGEAQFLLQIKFAFGKTKTETLNLKGKKFCRRRRRVGQPTAPGGENGSSNSNSSSTNSHPTFMNNDRSSGSDDADGGMAKVVTTSPNPKETIGLREKERDEDFHREEDFKKKQSVSKNASNAVNDSGASGSGGGPLGSLSDPNSTTVLALGAAAGAVALMFVLLTVMYATGRKRLPLPPVDGVDPALRLRHGPGGGADDLPPHYAADFIRKKAVAAATAAAGRKGHYRFNGGMGLAGTGSTLMRDASGVGVSDVDGLGGGGGGAARRAAGGGGGSYATLASFTNVPMGAVTGGVGRENQEGGGSTYNRNSSTGNRSQWLQQQQQRYYQQQQQQHQGQGQESSRWRNHYGSNQSSIWSSSQTMTSTVRGTTGRQPPGPGGRSSSQSTIFGRRPPDPTATLEPTAAAATTATGAAAAAATGANQQHQHPQQNSLVLENGMLKLMPKPQPQQQYCQSASSEPTLDIQAPDVSDVRRSDRKFTDTLKSNKTEEEILEMQCQLLHGPAAPFYQNMSGGFLAFSDDDEVGENDVDGEEGAAAEAEEGEAEGEKQQQQQPFSVYTPQIYPHLMPQNIAQAQAHRQQQQQQQQTFYMRQQHQQQQEHQQQRQQQSRMPRSTSGGSVLV